MPIPNQKLNVKDPGLGIVIPGPTAPLVLGTSSKGTDYLLSSYSRKNDAAAALGEGPLAEAATKKLDLGGGPVWVMKLPSTVAPTIGAVTPARVGTSTGTITVAITQAQIARCYQVDSPAASPVFTEYTTEVNNATVDDVIPFPAADAVGDHFAVGFAQKFGQIELNVSTAGVGGTVTWKYWNGTAWTALSGVSDATTGLTVAGVNTVAFTIPADWERVSLNNTEELYYVVAEIASGAYSTDPLIAVGAIDGYGAFDGYDVTVEIIKTGTLGTGTFRYSLDGGATLSGEIIIPSAGAFDIPFANITLTFVPNSGPVFFEQDDQHTFTVTEPYYTTAEVSAAVTALLAKSDEYPYIILTGTPASAADGATMFGALATHMASFAAVNRYVRIMMDVGLGTTTSVKTSFAAVADRRVAPVYGKGRIATSKGYTGWGAPFRSAVEIVGAWASNQLISTDLARVAEGPIPGLLEITHDENLTEELDAAGITTLRSLLGRAGFFVTNGRLKAPVGSDFQFWQFGRIMDVACRRVFITQQNFLNIGVRTNSDGTIDERDAARLESIVNEALRIELTQPSNAEGTRGHVSAVSYTIDRSNNINQSNTLQSEVAIRPLGYAKQIITEIGYSLNAGETA